MALSLEEVIIKVEHDFEDADWLVRRNSRYNAHLGEYMANIVPADFVAVVGGNGTGNVAYGPTPWLALAASHALALFNKEHNDASRPKY